MADDTSLPQNQRLAFVTGGTGLVGSKLISSLQDKGYAVRALYRKEIPLVPYANKVDWIKGDILDVTLLEKVMQKVDYVFHCAAVVSFNPRKKKELLSINVEGTANMVNASLHAGVEKFCHISSVSVFGKPRANQPVNEEMPFGDLKNNSNYGLSKHLAEMEVWRGIGEGLRAVIVNPSIILGAGNWHDGSSKIFKTAYEEFPWYTEGVTGFVNVKDVVNAMIMLVESPVQAQRFILSAENRTYRSIFAAIARAFGKRAPYKKVTPLMGYLVTLIEGLKSYFNNNEPLLTRETAEAAMMEVHFDNKKLLSFFPDFAYTPIDATIQSTCDEFKNTYNLY